MARPLRLQRHLYPVSRCFVRLFHPSPAAAARQAPATRRVDRGEPAARRTLGEPLDQSRYGRLSRDFPVETVVAARKDGWFDVDHKTYLQIATDLTAFAPQTEGLLPVTFLKAICQDETTIAKVAVILSYSTNRTLKAVALKVLRSLASLGEPLSVMALALTYVDLKPDSERSEVIKHLSSVARGGKYPQAIVLYNLFLERGEETAQGTTWLDPIQMLKYAHETAEPAAPFTVPMLPRNIPPPWLAYADKMAAKGQTERMVEALKVGAQKFDSPLAYERLADHLADRMRQNYAEDLSKYEEYLMKSAMEVNPVSCYLLGNLYLTIHLKAQAHFETVYGRSADPFTRKYDGDYYRMLTVEWYELAIQGGEARPALILAALLRHEGKERAMAEDYLAVAEENKGCAAKAKELRDHWKDQDWTIDILADLVI